MIDYPYSIILKPADTAEFRIIKICLHLVE